MLESLYKKTQTWGPGSCMVAFYLFSLIPIISVLLISSLARGLDFKKIVISDISILTHSLLVSPWFETLLFQVFLVKVFSIMKCRVTNIIIAVSIIFSIYHYTNGIYYPLIIFIPALVFTWNYYLYYEKNEWVWGFLTSSILHFLYNLTIFIMIPLINLVLTNYYQVDLLK